MRTGSFTFLNIRSKDTIAKKPNKDVIIINGKVPSIPDWFIEIPFDKSAAIIKALVTVAIGANM